MREFITEFILESDDDPHYAYLIKLDKAVEPGTIQSIIDNVKQQLPYEWQCEDVLDAIHDKLSVGSEKDLYFVPTFTY